MLVKKGIKVKTNIPYVYKIKLIKTGQFYYGYQGHKICTPLDLWSTYFTSSFNIKEMLNKYNKNEFNVSVIKTFDTAIQAFDYEQKIIRRTINFNNSLNLACHPGFSTSELYILIMER